MRNTHSPMFTMIVTGAWHGWALRMKFQERITVIRESILPITTPFRNTGLILRHSTGESMFFPVVIGLSNRGDDVLDFCLQAEMWSGRKKERGYLAPDTDIFYYDGAQQPERHFFAFTLQTN